MVGGRTNGFEKHLPFMEDLDLFQLAIDLTRECKLSKSRQQIIDSLKGFHWPPRQIILVNSVEILWPIAWSIWGPFNWLQAASQMWPTIPHICPVLVVSQSNPTLKFCHFLIVFADL